MSRLASYTVTHVDEITLVSTNITSYVEVIDVHEVGNEQVNYGILRLNAFKGKFLTVAPVMDQFDKIRIQMTDKQSTPNSFDRYYEVSTITPIESTQEGNVVELELLGQEYHVGKIHFAKQYYFSNAYDVVKDLAATYNANKGTKQPEIEDGADNSSNELPKWTANHYDFNISEEFIADGITTIIDSIGASVLLGGAGDFFDTHYINGSTSDKIILTAFVSGSKPAAGSEITLTDTDDINGDPSEGGIEAKSASIVGAWGDDEIGSLPPDWAEFHSILESYSLYPTWLSGVVYPTNSRVSYNGSVYQKNISTGTDTPPTNWTVKTRATLLSGKQYAPWTKDLGSAWVNNGSAPLSATGPVSSVFTGTGAGCWDGNLVIRDDTYYRTDAIARAVKASQLPVNYMYGGTSAGAYRGMRILVDTNRGAQASPFSGNDKNGVAYADNVAQYDGSDWIVKTVSADNHQVAIMTEGKVYEKQTGSWTDVSTVDRGNECFHPWTTLESVTGMNTTYGANSAIKVTYTFDYATAIIGKIFNTAGYYKLGAWLDFKFPFPFSTDHSVTTLGELYGNNATKKEPVTFDTNNMHLSHSGNIGFNHSEATDLGLGFGLRFNTKLDLNVPQQLVSPIADFKMRCFMYDTSDNVVFQDFTIDFNDHWEQKTLPFNKFEPYRGRIPLRWGDKINNVFTQDLDILNVFEYKNVAKICFQWQESYDDQGRYNPALNQKLVSSTIVSGTTEFYIDGFHIAKTLMAITAPVTDRTLEIDFIQAPQISNQVQLDQLVNSQLQVEQSRRRQYDIRTEGAFDIPYGYTFFLNKTKMVVDDDTRTADTGGTANTIRLVARDVRYRVTKTGNSPGVFERYITGVKRFL